MEHLLAVEDSFIDQGIIFNDDEAKMDCLLCSFFGTEWSVPSANVIVEEVVRKHCHEDAGHVRAFEKYEKVEDYCPVEINGRRMLLDHHVVYPSTMFGPGRMLFDHTLSSLLPADCCGGVWLFPLHRYSIVEFGVPKEEVPIPKWDRPRLKVFKETSQPKDVSTDAIVQVANLSTQICNTEMSETFTFLSQKNADMNMENMMRRKRRRKT